MPKGSRPFMQDYFTSHQCSKTSESSCNKSNLSCQNPCAMQIYNTHVGAERLFPSGEGAGFAGGIVSAAVDGMIVAEAVLELLNGAESSSKQWKESTKSVGYSY